MACQLGLRVVSQLCWPRSSCMQKGATSFLAANPAAPALPMLGLERLRSTRRVPSDDLQVMESQRLLWVSSLDIDPDAQACAGDVDWGEILQV